MSASPSAWTAQNLAGALEIGRLLAADGYLFRPVTPTTHALVEARDGSPAARDLRDVFGWSRPLDEGRLDPEIVRLLETHDLLSPATGNRRRARLRFASVDARLYAHSAYPTDDDHAVFFGPDTYRFLRLLDGVLPPCGTLVDVGCGSGVGGLEQLTKGRAERIILTDINDTALAFARLNLALRGEPSDPTRVSLRHGSLLEPCDAPVDAIIANPPFLVDDRARTYRHGGGALGTALSLAIVEGALTKLRRGGTLVLYTASPIVGGRDVFRDEAWPLLAGRAAAFSYEEIDPDIFGQELQKPAYREVERLAAVALIVTR